METIQIPHARCPECDLIFSPEWHTNELFHLKAENARYRKALEHYAMLTEPYCSMNIVALNALETRKALKGGE